MSLWLAFHTLMWNEERKDDNEIGVKEMYDKIRQWVDTDFGCGRCSKHFKDHLTSNPKADDESYAMHLWRIHNIINADFQKVKSNIGMKHFAL